MAFDLSNAANILKVRYLGPIREQLNGATVLLKKIGRDENSMNVSGKSFTVPLHTSRNTSAGVGRADGGTLPTAGQQGYQVAVIPNKYQYGRIQITGPTIRAARDNAGAFVTAVESEIRGLTRDFQKGMNRQLLGDGTDALAYWTTGDDTIVSGTALADDNQGNAFVHINSSGTWSCDLVDASNNNTVLGTGYGISLGAKGATSYTLNGSSAGSNPTGSADGDYLVLAGTLGYQMMGIDGIISTADSVIPAGGGGASTGLHGLAAATYPWWTAQVFSNSGTKRDLTLALMQEPLSAISVNSDFTEKDVEFMLCNYNIRDKYVSLLVADKRFVNTMTLDGGFTGLDFNGIPLVPDPQCKRNTIYYIVPESLKIFRTSDFDWMDKDGSTLSRVANADAYEATMFHYGDLGTIARNACAKLGDITD